MLRLVQQQCDVSCGVACVAMVANMGFAAVLQLCPRPNMVTLELDWLLRKVGLKATRERYPEIEPGRLYIASVASLNKPGGMHFVVLDTRGAEAQVYDPQKGREGMEFYTPHTLGSVAALVEVQASVRY